MSTFYGVALLPEQRVSDVITAFQQRHAKELHWPLELEYVPHVSLLQGPWERRDLTQQRLVTIADHAPYDPLNRIKGYFINLNVLSHQWISLRVHPISEPNASDLYNWHMVACDVCNDMTDHEVLKHAQREPGWSDDEWHNYCDWGYPYIELDFKPHVTLGHIAENKDIDLQPLITDWKQVFGSGLMYGSGDKIVYLFVNAELTGIDKLYLEAYDAIIGELPPYSHWSKSAQDECKRNVLQQTEEYNIAIEVNGTVIKRKE